MKATCRIQLENRLEEFQRFESAFMDFARFQNLNDEVIYAIQLSVDELFTNIVSYGYDDSETHIVKFVIDVTQEEVRIEIVDDAKPFNPLDDAPDVNLDLSVEERKIGGVGIHLVKSLMSEVTYVRDGDYNRLRLVKKFEN
ncbi:MAG: ATP-binding protein [Gammaproteobacteria bacterium]|nr:ATP-binding protein [Gammaproteobacteria bacterium]MYF03426.1 ATP-binding protein [Gammaproteobacteria bacterium]